MRDFIGVNKKPGRVQEKPGSTRFVYSEKDGIIFASKKWKTCGCLNTSECVLGLSNLALWED